MMIRKIFLALSMVGMGSVYVQADYVIQLGLYKNRSLLQQEINRIDNAELKSNVVIEKREGMYWAHSKAFKDKKSMNRELSLYKKYFNDAFPKKIASVKKEQVKIMPPVQEKAVENTTDLNTTTPIVQNDQTEPMIESNTTSQDVEQNATLTAAETDLLKDIAENLNEFSFKERLMGNIFYVCFEEKDREIVRIEFDENNASYSTVSGNGHLFEVQFDVVDDRLYLFRDQLPIDGIYSTLDKVDEKYLLISSWKKGEKVNTIRYYLDLNDAMEYMQGK